MKPEVISVDELSYREWIIRLTDAFNPFMYEFVHTGYGGPGDPRCGFAHTVADAVEQIEEMED